MKIYLQLTPFFPSEESFRGPFILDQVKALKANSDFQLVVVKVVDRRSQEVDYVYNGISVIIFKCLMLPSGIFPSLLDWFNVTRLYNLLLKKGIDINAVSVVHGHVTFPCGSLSVKLVKKYFHKAKSIIQHHGFDVFSLSNGILRNVKVHHKYLTKKGVKFVNQASLNIGVSQKTLSFLKEYEGVNLKKEYVLYNGVDTQKFYLKKNEEKNKNQFVIGCVANFWPIKGQLLLIKAVEQLILDDGLSDIFVRFVGTGPTLEGCKALVNEKGLNRHFEFIEMIPHNELPNYYRGLDLFVLPSHYEAMGCVYLEAHACGVPFVGVIDQGIDELIDKDFKTSAVVTPRDFIDIMRVIKLNYSNKTINKLTVDSIDINDLIRKFLCEI